MATRKQITAAGATVTLVPAAPKVTKPSAATLAREAAMDDKAIAAWHAGTHSHESEFTPTVAKPSKAVKAAPKAAPKASPLPTVTTPTTKAKSAPLVVAAPLTGGTAVMLRGGPAVSALTIGPRVYRVGTGHTQQAWQAVQQAIATAGGKAPTQAVLAAVAASPVAGMQQLNGFVNYCVRRGYLAAA